MSPTENSILSPGLPRPLGVTLVPGGLNVAVSSRHAARIWFCLFDPTGIRETARIPLAARTGDIHHAFVPAVAEGARYGLRADGPWAPEQGQRFDPEKLLVDPYALELDRPFAYHADLALPRAAARDTSALVPKAIVRRTPAPAMRASPRRPGFVYEVSIKAFTKLHPGVPEPLRGTVAALATPAIIEHLKRIGADTIELMPLTAWIDERHLHALNLSNAWGYNSITFLAPDPRLAPGGMREIADTLRTLHDNGIRVLLDMVLNHTGEGDDVGPILSLRGLDNATYYRHATDDPSRMINDTGCGNTIALDRPPMVQLAMDSLRHWVRLGFDGFRFDLAPVLGRLATGYTPDAPLLTAIRQDPELSAVTLIAEPWDVGPGGYQLGNFPAPWMEWNDKYRDDVRRFWRGDRGAASALATRLAGSADVIAGSRRPPSASVNFIAAHDGFPLADLTAYQGKHNEANGESNRDGSNDNWSWNGGAEGVTQDSNIRAARARDVRAMLATLFLSRGTPMLTAGDDMGRTQGGNNNAYAQDNAITWLDWVHADENLIGLTGRLSDLRTRHPLLFADRFLTGRPPLPGAPPDAIWLRPDGATMADGDWAGADVLGLYLQEGTDKVCLWFNRTQSDAGAILPQLAPSRSWQIALATTPWPDTAALAPPAGTLRIPARSVVVCTVTERAG
jgi:glycogen debranching enzyme